jgi:hypothetical protein
MPEKTVHFKDMSQEQVAGFLQWVESEQESDGCVLEVDGEVWRVWAHRHPRCSADGCDTLVKKEGETCLEHAGRDGHEAGPSSEWHRQEGAE